MKKDEKSFKGPLFYFLVVLVLLIGIVGWTSYQFGQQSIKNSKNSIQFVDQSDRIEKNAKAIMDLTKQTEILSSMTPKDGKDGANGKDGTNSVSHDTMIEKQTVQQVPVKGDSAYQTWLGIGNSGSEEDFISSLKGEDAHGIEGCSLDGVLGWRYIGDITCKVNISSLAKGK